MKLINTLIASFAFLATGAAHADIVSASDNFDGASSGWANSWQLAGGRTAPAAIKLAGADSALVITGNNDNAAVRTLADTQSGDVFVDFTLQYSGTLGANDFVGLWFGSYTGPNIGLKANCGVSGPCTNDLFVRMSGSGGTYLLMSDLQAGTSYALSGHLYKAGNSSVYNRFAASFKPAGSNVAGALVTATGNSNLTSFSRVGVRSANIDNGVSVVLDDLRIAEVPEPGSVALFGLALAGFAVMRRRKNA